jgi:DNA-binding LacI/PurR family transcriptional regulator
MEGRIAGFPNPAFSQFWNERGGCADNPLPLDAGFPLSWRGSAFRPGRFSEPQGSPRETMATAILTRGAAPQQQSQPQHGAGFRIPFGQIPLVKPIRILSAAEQVAHHLKDCIAHGELTGFMPGGAVLARGLGIGRTTADAALDILTADGLLAPAGERKRRRIIAADTPGGTKPMRVCMILYEPSDAANQYVPEVRQLLLASGFGLELSPKTLTELNHDPAKVGKMVRNHPADAWVVCSGSRPVLEWFSESPFPAFALFGRMQRLAMPGIKPDKRLALGEAMKTLVGHGHRKIVLLVREDRRKPSFGDFETAFLNQLGHYGIRTGPYNIPEWTETASGLRRCIDRLFDLTPPTAIFVGDSVLFLAVQNILRNQASGDSKKVVLISTDYHPHMDWCDPPVPHFTWNHRTTARRVLGWLKNLQRDRPDQRQTFVPTGFVEGGSGVPIRSRIFFPKDSKARGSSQKSPAAHGAASPDSGKTRNER